MNCIQEEEGNNINIRNNIINNIPGQIGNNENQNRKVNILKIKLNKEIGERNLNLSHIQLNDEKQKFSTKMNTE